MTASRTYADLYNRIADELGGRTDLLSNSTNMTTPPIQLAVLDAIRYWENDRFFFNEVRATSTFSTVASQEFYTSSDWSVIPNIKHIDKLTIVANSTNRYRCTGRTPQYIEEVSVGSTVTGMPSDYSYYNEQIRFYPIPNAAYPVYVLYTKQFTELASASDSNVWTNEAEALTRHTAEWFLYRDTIKDDVAAARLKASAREDYTSLKGETLKRGATLRLTPTAF